MINRLKLIHPLFLISIVFWVVNAILFHRYGIQIMTDSPRYLEYAEGLRNGFYFDLHNFWYIGYVLFIYLIQLISDQMGLIILAQSYKTLLVNLA